MSLSPAERSRRRLPKSKTGCRTCKRRKVKCDEARPACRNCVKHGVECDFIAPGDIPTPASSSSNQPLYFGTISETPGFTIEDLELLHHYTTSACLTISTEPLMRNFWRVNVPQMGFTTPYILRSILAISALHLARFRPDRKEYLISQAFHHNNAALAMASPLINDIDRENCVQLFLFSSITNFFAFGKPREPTDFLLANTHLPNNHAVPDWLYIFRGVRVLLEAEGATLHASSIAVMFESGMQMHDFWLTHKFENEAIRELETNIRNSVGDNSELRDLLLHTMDALQRSFAQIYEAGQTEENRTRGIFVWLYKIRASYITLVGEGNNEALCILAFFCVLLRRLDYLWWVEGWGLHLIERIYSRLDDAYKLWIRWPIEEIGWVPDYSRTLI